MPRRIPRFSGAVLLAALLATSARAAEDPLDTLAGPASSRFT